MKRQRKPDEKGYKTLLFSVYNAIGWQMYSFCIAKGVLLECKRSPFKGQKGSF